VRNAKPTRRDVLKVGLSGLSVISLAGSMPAFVTRFARADAGASPEQSNDNILVVVQMSGGNDGLNTVIPVGDDAYIKARPKIALKERAHKLTDDYALNPGMEGFKELFDAGKLAIINGCGYPSPNRSHFRSMEIWQTANPKKSESAGWLGHYIDHCLKGTTSPGGAGGALRAINIGGELPQTLVAESGPVPSITSIKDFGIRVDGAIQGDAKAAEKMIRDFSTVQEQTPALQFLSRQATNALISGDQIRKLAGDYKPDANYPYQGLGQNLKLVAQLIHANLGTRLYYCNTGGFDTHANQVPGQERSLGAVSDAIAAFMKDMTAKGFDKKVTVMCFSEFGRRVKQNDSNGTDHGAAGPMFLVGGKVKGGLHGTYPSLTDLTDGDLKYTTDFRSVYATIVQDWLNGDSEKVLSGKFATMPLFA
jgi:uncharacterized protein (DUF1501 family)